MFYAGFFTMALRGHEGGGAHPTAGEEPHRRPLPHRRGPGKRPKTAVFRRFSPCFSLKIAGKSLKARLSGCWGPCGKTRTSPETCTTGSTCWRCFRWSIWTSATGAVGARGGLGRWWPRRHLFGELAEEHDPASRYGFGSKKHLKSIEKLVFSSVLPLQQAI